MLSQVSQAPTAGYHVRARLGIVLRESVKSRDGCAEPSLKTVSWKMGILSLELLPKDGFHDRRR